MNKPVCVIVAVLALVVGSAAVAAADASVAQVATLTLSDGQSSIGALAVSGVTLAGAGVSAVDVFTEPASGWSSESQAATLLDPAAAPDRSVPGISGGTVVVGEHAGTGPGFEDVFVEPGGWSGTVLPAARLVVSDGGSLSGGAISGSTIVAEGSGAALGFEVSPYVFTEPPGGWSGNVSEVARLRDSRGANFGPGVAMSGDAIFALTTAGVDVFIKPPGGWSGTVTETATLESPLDMPLAPLEVSGSVVLAGTSVFHLPAGGWSGTVRPTATLFSAAYPASEAAFSGDMAALNVDQWGPGNQCPCTARVSLFTEPPGGWTGTVIAPAAITATTSTDSMFLAIQDPYLFSAPGGNVRVYRMSGSSGAGVGPPRIKSPSASGLASGHPRLSFTIATGAEDPPLRSLTLTLPKGLAFVNRHRQRTKGISITATGGYTLSVQHRVLAVRLASPSRSVRVQIHATALAETAAMIRAARRLRKPSRTKTKAVVAFRAELGAADITADCTSLTARFLLK